MHRIIIACALLVLVRGATAVGEHEQKLLNANIDLDDKASLQRGARMFVNYCVSCHSASFMRYNRIASDLGIPESVVKANMMFTTDKTGDPLTVAMRPSDAEKWFGVPPPDLSVIARARGADWLYTFLLTFHIDEKRPTGVNNLAFPDTAMPHVLWELQGLQRAVYRTDSDHEGRNVQVLEHLEPASPGKLTDAEYKRAARDLVGFVVYLGEPAQLVRYKIGVYVLAFLLVLFIVTYLLKREYWKDVH